LKLMGEDQKYTLDASDERVFCGGSPMAISNKAYKLLMLFVENPNQLLTKSHILDALWEEINVTEGMVKEYVHELRVALNDDARAPRYIQTVHGRGYRYLGGIEVIRGTASVSGVPIPDKPSIAVLAFNAQSLAPEDVLFGDGLCDELTTSLSLVPWLFVIARNTSRNLGDKDDNTQDVGELLGVRYILRGSIRRSGKQLRIHAELSETELGSLLWARRFDAKTSDLFSLQDEMTIAVVNTIGPRIQLAEIDRAVRKPPGNLTAYDQLLRAKAALNIGNVGEARTLLDIALDTDPDYTMARALRAWCVTLIGWKFRILTDDDVQQAIQQANQVLASSDCDIEARAFAAYTLGFFGVDTGHARLVLQQVTQDAPSFAWAWASLALLEAYHGAPKTAIRCANNALELNPRDPQSFRCEMAICKALLVQKDYQQSLFYSDLGLQKSPKNAYFQMCRITSLVQLGRIKDAEALGARFRGQHPEFDFSAWKALAANWTAWDEVVVVVAAALVTAKVFEF
jgi:TolB-like protein